jgi:hypothetical protein
MNLTPSLPPLAKARADFHALVRAEMADKGVDYDTAFMRVSAAHAELINTAAASTAPGAFAGRTALSPRAQARAEFHALVATEMRQNGVDYDTAFCRVSRRKAELSNALSMPVPQTAGGSASAQLLVGFSNTFSVGTDGLAQIAPFGDFPGVAFVCDAKGCVKKVRAMQRINKQAVTQMINENERAHKGLTRFSQCPPLYFGHPDIPGCELQYPDKGIKGVFSNLVCREDGLWGELILTEEGDRLISSGRARALSGRWEAEPVSNENGIEVYRPTRLLSAGLTNRPNLPVQMLNEAL